MKAMKVIAIFSARSGAGGGRLRDRCGWRRFCGLSARRGWGVGRSRFGYFRFFPVAGLLLLARQWSGQATY